jgi:hypothetical protein
MKALFVAAALLAGSLAGIDVARSQGITGPKTLVCDRLEQLHVVLAPIMSGDHKKAQAEYARLNAEALAQGDKPPCKMMRLSASLHAEKLEAYAAVLYPPHKLYNIVILKFLDVDGAEHFAIIDRLAGFGWGI